MTQSTGKWLIRYGALILALGIGAVMYDGASGVVGFNPRAISGLISGVVCGGLAIGWGMLARRGRRWALVAALVTALLFLAAFLARTVMAVSAVLNGVTAKAYAASLLMGMALSTLAIVVLLVVALRAGSGRKPVQG